MPLDLNKLALAQPGAPLGLTRTPRPTADTQSSDSLWESAGNWLKGTGAAVASGIISDPFIGGAMELVSKEFPSAAPDKVLSTLQEMRGQPGDKFFELAGNLLPMFATGAGAMMAGRAGGAAAARLLSPTVAAFAEQGGLGAARGIAAIPNLLRGAEIAGMSLGAGAEGYTRTLAEGGDQGEALQRGALSTALVGGVEGAMWGGSRALWGRPIHLSEMVSRVNEAALATAKPLQLELDTITSTLTGNVAATRLNPHNSMPAAQLVKLMDRQKVLQAQIDQLPVRPLGTAQKTMDRAADMFGQNHREALDQINFLQKQSTAGMKADDLVAHERMITEATMASRQAYMSSLASRTASQFLRNPEADHTATQFYFGLPSGAAKDTKLFGFIPVAARINEYVSSMTRKLAESPSTTARKLGVTMTRVVNLTSEAAQQARAWGVMWGNQVDQDLTRLGAAVGVKHRAHGDADWLIPFRDMWEAKGQGLPAIKAKYGAPAANIWHELMTRMAKANDIMAAYGVEPKLNRAALDALGLGNYFPHHIRFTKEMIDDAGIAKVIRYWKVRGRDLNWDEARAEMEKLADTMDQGLKRAGSLDFQRTMPGTTAEKLDPTNGLGFEMESDPRRAILAYGQGHAHRFAWGQVFGPNMELKSKFLEAAVAEGADPRAAREVLDNLLGVKYQESAMREVSRFLGNAQVLSKLGLAWLPNLTQSLNAPVMLGMQKGFHGLWEGLRGVDRDQVTKALGVTQGLGDSIADVINGVEKPGPMSWAVQKFLSYTGFNKGEEFNRLMSGHVGQYVIRDTVGKLVQGRLRGARYAEAERLLDQLGINMRAIHATAKANGYMGQHLSVAQIDTLVTTKAMHSGISNATKLLQFVPDITRLPEWWTHPTGRLVFQFKSFAFNQAKLIRDTVLKEAGNGNLKPLMGLLSVYPVAGEAVASAQSMFRDKGRTSSGLTRVVEDMASMGAFGLALSGVQALSYKDFAGFALGPTFSDLQNGLEAMASGNIAQSLTREITRKPTYLLGRGLGHVAGGAAWLGATKITELYDAAEGAMDPTEPMPDVPTVSAGSLRDHLKLR